MDLQELSIKLAHYEADGVSFESFIIHNNNQDVIQIIVDGNDELPIFVTQTQEQILCICYLFDGSEIKQEKALELNDVLLRLNVPMPLSSFAKIDDKYAVYGALATSSSLEQIGHEVVTLAANSIDALEAISDYLID